MEGEKSKEKEMKNKEENIKFAYLPRRAFNGFPFEDGAKKTWIFLEYYKDCFKSVYGIGWSQVIPEKEITWK